ncbi:golgin subfamily A member 6-like protein 22 [Asparagus officinalis]|uniref:golgin subfamily A member 6-like protein 22 n=1 Tax=Asparagus officinalis TaxID=4686 RepID=UPI00098E2CE0|nr:golgin subfamily A member 6-like protein 22 [Asparagus officinalis]XP_020262496.1 golgin subfamily A member 6-like protein 22 [Asparagus officinalis]
MEQTRVRKKNEEEKVKDGKQDKVKGRTRSSSIGYILAQHIRDAFESEDEIEKLTTEDQIQFWRNTAKINWKLLHTVKRSKRLQWEECSKEIHRLNKKLERYEGTADLIDPEDLKKNVKGIMSQKEGHTGSAQKKIRRSIDSEDRGDDGICFDYDEVTNIGKEAEKELEKGEWQEMEDDNLEKAVESEEDKKEEVTVDEKKEEEREQEKNEEEEEEEEKVEEEKHQKKDEEIVVENREGECAEEKKDEERMESLEEEKGKKKDEEKVVENREGECAEEKLDEERMEDGKQVQVYQKRMKRLASKGTRGPSTRRRTRSQLVRTPFTQEKKKEVHQEIINISHHKEEEREKIRFYCKPDECTWDFLGKRKIKKKEEALLKLLNEDIPNIDDFSIRLIDSKGTFVHNFRVPQHVLSKLTPDENRRISEFCNQKAHQ